MRRRCRPGTAATLSTTLKLIVGWNVKVMGGRFYE
jgi:hypothetical protein